MVSHTCADASIGQVRRDCDPPALVDAHALQTSVHPCDEFTEAHLTDEGFASVIAAQAGWEVGGSGKIYNIY